MAHEVDKELVFQTIRDTRGRKEPSMYPESASTENGGSLKGGYTIQDVEKALHCLAWNGGNANATSIQLSEEFKLNVTAQTLRNWQKSLFPRRYVEIQRQLRGEINHKTAALFMENAQRSGQVREEMISRLADEHQELPVKELPNAIKALAVTSDVDVKGAALLRGEPTEIVQDRTPEEIVRKLQSLNVLPEDEVDAEIVEEDRILDEEGF